MISIDMLSLDMEVCGMKTVNNELKSKVQLMYELDKILYNFSINVDAYCSMILVLDDMVKRHRKCIIKMFSCINHELDFNDDHEEVMLFYDKVIMMLSKLPKESLLYNTYIRLISGYHLTSKELKEETEFMIPCAYDRDLLPVRYGNSELNVIKFEFVDYLRNGKSKFIVDVRDMIKGFNFLRKPTMLSNNTSMDDINGIDMNDIIQQIYGNEKWYDMVKPILDFFDKGNEYDYIEYRPKHEITSSFIPDKGLKVRIIYRICGYLSVALKYVHNDLDRIARHIEGNYTYDQMGWLIGLVNNNYHKNCLIVTTDMSKYSDTLPWEIIAEVLKWRYPNDVVDAITNCYQSTMYDKRHDKYYEDLMSSLQGLFGDFPLITVVNLCMQDFIYHKLGLNHGTFIEPYRNAGVGDDTGMVFFNYHNVDKCMDMIYDCYNAIGVNINMDKTHFMDHGVGFIDFVKLKLTKNGIGFSFSGRGLIDYGAGVSYDVFIRDICNYVNNLSRLIDPIMVTYYKDTINYLKGSDYKWLFEVSIINGGLNKDYITESDIATFIYRLYKVHDGEITKYDDVTKFEMANRLRDIKQLCKHIDITKTRLRLILDEDDELTEDNIILKLLNVMSLGYSTCDPGKYDLFKLVGYNPEYVYNVKLDSEHDYPEDVKRECEFLNCYPLVPRFGKSKHKDAYLKLKDIVLNKRYTNIKPGFIIKGNLSHTFESVSDMIQHFRRGDDYHKISKIMTLVRSYAIQHNIHWEHCVFGTWYDYIVYNNKSYIIGNHPTSRYDCISNEIIELVLHHYGYNY